MSSKPSKTLTNLSNPSRGKQGEFPPPDPGRKKQLAAFQKTAGIRFMSVGLLNLSFVHRSLSNETGCRQVNERLEFLGDSVLGAVCATLLYQKFPEKSEGELAKMKSVAVCEDVLSEIALSLRIDTMLLLGKGEELSGGRNKNAILADTLEALIGALYLDSGFKAAFTFVSRFLNPEIDRISKNNHHRDYKSLLQEFCMQNYRVYPVYKIVKRSGPDHEQLFLTEVNVNGTVFGPGTGRNKKPPNGKRPAQLWKLSKEKRKKTPYNM